MINETQPAELEQVYFHEMTPRYIPVGVGEEAAGRKFESADWMQRQVEILKASKASNEDIKQEQGEQ